MFGQKGVPSRLFTILLIEVIFLLFLSFSSWTAEIKDLEELPLFVIPPGWFRASRIIDHPVKNDRREELGKVDDLIIRRNGRVKEAILSVGPFLGRGDRLVAVSFSVLKMDEKGDILYRVTKEQLEKHPVYTYRSNYPYGLYSSPDPPRPPTYDLYLPGRERYYPYARGWIPFSPDRMSLSRLLGMTLIGDQGEPMGQVDDFIIHFEEGKIEKIILWVNDILKERRVALPFLPLELSPWGIYYHVTREQIDLMPEFKNKK
jgi:sporulation protein YlmC with PRC-barrel domain